MGKAKKWFSLFIIISMFGFIGACSVTTNDNDETTKEILDLRIKKGSKLYEPRSITHEGETTGDTVTTPHVTAKPINTGIQFVISCPEDPCYADGFGVVLIYRIEDGDNTTGALLDSRSVKDSLNLIYPLCEPGEEYRFKVQIEPPDVNNNRDYQYYEYITITATGGIGDIDYSNINVKDWVTADYSNDLLTVRIDDCIPPEAVNVKTYADFFAGNGDWETNNATVWFTNYTGSEIELSFTPDPEWTEAFRLALQSTGKTQFFAQYQFCFEIPDCTMVTRWTTKAINSNIVQMD